MNGTKLFSLSSVLIGHANRRIQMKLREAGITDIVPSYGDVLMCLMHAEDKPLGVCDIAAKMHRTKSTISFLVDKLVVAGYVEKKPNPKDSRALQILLTQKGEALRGVFDEISDDVAGIVTQALGTEKLAEIEAAMRTVIENFETRNEEMK